MDVSKHSKLQAICYAIVLSVVVVCISVHATGYAARFVDLTDSHTLLQVSLITPLMLAPPVSLAYAFYAVKLIEAREELAALAQIDPLTGLLNRRAFLKRMHVELDRMDRTGAPACLLIVDIDDFRNVNNTYGHNAGDVALAGVAEAMLACFRNGTDSVGRWGGEEFIVLLAETDLSGAKIAGERLRKVVERMSIDYAGVQISITLSLGAVALTTEDTPEVAVARADHCLYAAKAGGRNRLVAARPEPVDFSGGAAALSS